MTLNNVTLVHNEATTGNGIFSSGNVSMNHSLFINDRDDFAGTGYDSDGFNISTGDIVGGDGVSDNSFVDETQINLDPLLRLNSGITPTHALLPGSVAIDAGDSFSVATDQRGFARDTAPGNAVDIGAFEFGATTLATPIANDDSLSISENESIDSTSFSEPSLLENDELQNPVIHESDLTLNFDAGTESSTDGVWNDQLLGFGFQLNGNAVLQDVDPADTASGITAAYRFDGSGPIVADSYQNLPDGDATESPATFEFWIRPENTTFGRQVIFDSGFSFLGTSIIINDVDFAEPTLVVNYTRFDALTTGQIAEPLDSEVIASGDFFQIALTINPNDDSVSLYVNGIEIASETQSGISDWSASADGVAIGGVNGTILDGALFNQPQYDNFEGEIAVHRFYERELSAGEILDNYNALYDISAVAETVESANGVSVNINADGTFDYDPGTTFDSLQPGQIAGDSFEYQTIAASGEVQTATANLTIEGTNDAVALQTNESLTVMEGGTETIDSSLLNEGDVDDDRAEVSYLINSNPSNGTLMLDGNPIGSGATVTQNQIDNGLLEYVHNGSESTSDSFQFLLSDGGENGSTMVSGQFQIEITPVNDAPSARFNFQPVFFVDDNFNQISQSTFTFEDPEQSPGEIEFTLNALPLHGILELDGAALGINGTFTQEHINQGRLTYSHNATSATTDSIQLTVSDGIDSVGTTFDIIAANTVTEGSIGNVFGTDIVVVTEDPASYRLLSPLPGNGTLFVSGAALGVDGEFTLAEVEAGLVTYDHDGSDTFSDFIVLEIREVSGHTEVRTINLRVNPIAEAPELDLDLNNSSMATGLDFQTSFTENGGLVSVADVDATIVGLGSGQFNRLTVNLAGFVDGVEEDIRVNDLVFNLGESRIETTVVGGTTISVNFTGAGFTVTNDAGGTIPRADLEALIRSMRYEHLSENPTAGDRTWQFVVQDDNGESSAVATTTLSVVPINDAPFSSRNTGATFDEGSVDNVLTPAMLRYLDVDNNPIEINFTVMGLPTNGVLSLAGTELEVGDSFTQADINSGRVSYSHNGSETLSDGFMFEVIDGGDDGVTSSTGTFAIQVTPVNDDPIAEDDIYIVGRGGTLDIGLDAGVLLNDSDPDGDTLTVSIVDSPNGSLTLNPNGTFSYTHDGSTSSVDSFTYQVDDGSGGAPVTAIVTIHVSDEGFLATDEFRVDTTSTQSHDTGSGVGLFSESSVSSRSNGDYVVAWTARGSFDDVLVQRFDFSGAPLGDPIEVSTGLPGIHTSASVAMAEDGSFVVVWTNEAQSGDSIDGTESSIYFQKFDIHGNPQTGVVPVNTGIFEAGAQSNPDVSVNANGNFVVSYSGAGPVGNNDAFFATFQANGDPISGPLIASEAGNGSGFERNVQITLSDDDRVVAAWDDGNSIHLNTYDLNGTPLGSERVVNFPSDVDSVQASSIDINSDGLLALAFESTLAADASTEVRVLVVDIDTWQTAATEVNDTSTGQQNNPSVSWGKDGVLVVTYDGFRSDDSPGVYACLLYTSPSPRDRQKSRMPSSA